MGNLFDYLEWRGDLPLRDVPLGEADNVLLCELAYADLEGSVPGDGTLVPIDEVCERFWSRHTEEEIKKDVEPFRMPPMLLNPTRDTERFGKMKLSHFVNSVSGESGEQMSAVTFHLDDGTVFVAFRGTDKSLVGWKEDFCLSYMERTAGQKKAVDYLNRVADSLPADVKIRVGGHSKGGNFAIYASCFCREALRERITEIYTNDGPGFIDSITKTREYEQMLSRIRSFIPELSIFGLLLETRFPHTIIRSSAKGIMQHDAFSWEIMGGRVVRGAGRTEGSILVEQVLDKWIKGIPAEKKKEFIDSLFDMFARTGAEQLTDVTRNFLGSYMLIKSFLGMGERDQKILVDTLSSLFRSGADRMYQELSSRLNDKKDEAKDLEAEGAKTVEK
ncbi:MAG: DUF2974 domain-containing protein [Lachnospiraceae bacterium]|nr:DUF2974 domain-containing protein [Lachnospiraceae bacterium]